VKCPFQVAARQAHHSLSRVAVFCFALVVISCGGCAALAPGHNDAEALADPDAPRYEVIFASSGEPEVFEGVIKGPMTVQDALEESGATRRYRHLMVDLARAVPEKDHVLKLPIQWNHEERHVMEEQNYALHPGDELLVRRDTSGPLSAVLDTLSPGN
jgi:hypothetical protein